MPTMSPEYRRHRERPLKRTAFELSVGDLNALQKQSKKEERSVSYLLRQAVRQFLQHAA
jgi:hypothetical protein